MKDQTKKWLLLVILSLIWGSSFILIKKGLVGLNAFQVGALRIFFTSLFLFSVGYKEIRGLSGEHWKWIFISGILGSGIPPFLFALAQQHIDSAIASILNSLTPLNTLITGMLAFGIYATRKQVYGVFIGLLGTVMLILAGAEFNPHQNYWYSLLIIIASVGYAFNVNIIKSKLSSVSALAITTGNFVFLVLPAVVILWVSGFFETVFSSPEMQTSVFYILILSLFGTAIAKVLFNKLIQVASPVFASSVTYVMPLIAVLWGALDGERLHIFQVIGGIVILIGVYLSNKKIRGSA